MTANLRRRKLFSGVFEVLCALAVVIALIPLAMILFYVIKEGAGALNWDFFTKMPKPVGETGGGMANAIVGTLILIGIAALFAFDFSADLEANATAMSRVLSSVKTIEVTRAVRARELDGLKIAENDVIGLLDDKIVEAGSSAEDVAYAVLTRIDPGEVGTVTIYAGVDASDQQRETLRGLIVKQFPDASVELQSGEQALYPYVLAVE